MKQGEELEKLLNKLGVNLYNKIGQIRGLNDILSDLAKIWNNLPVQSQTEVINIFITNVLEER
jgi:hypothetical protein